MTVLDYYPLLTPLAPLAAAFLTALPRTLVRETSYRIGVFFHVAALVVAVQVLRVAAAPGHPATDLLLVDAPLSSPLRYVFHLDRLAAVMMVLISGIGTLIYLYSLRYMRQESGRARYHTLLSLTIAVLLCMVSSGNLLLLFLCWQLLSWLLSFLAYNHVHPPTARGAFRTFAMLRFGDVGFLAGIILAYSLYGTLDLQELFARVAREQDTFSFWPGGPALQASTAVTLLLFIGAMSKSAQVPLHMWLPDSLYAPTPVHALLHAGIINAGGFLINRLAPLYGASPMTLHLVFAVGLCTALLGAGMMLAQNDIKKTLGYSTIGQMGYMIMECGLGAFALAVFHLIAHGLFKATIFLNCGNVIHLARQEPRRPEAHQKTGAAAASPDDEEGAGFSTVAWLTGFVTTLILPLVILLAAHGALSLPMRDSQGAVIFLFFSWVTSSQAILTLYRVRAIASRKVAALMLATLVAVVLTYLLAAEAFTYFLYPAPGEVGYYFQAAALPSWLFDGIVAVTSLFVIVGWMGLYAKSRGTTMPLPGRLPERLGRLQVRLYLFLINRLYLDAAAFSLDRTVTGLVRRLDQSRMFTALAAAAALAAIFVSMDAVLRLPPHAAGLLALAAVTVPLFPFHGLYLVSLTRLPGNLPFALALLPAVGWFALSNLPAGLPPELWRLIGELALIGAAFGSIKALAQFRVRRLVAYAGLVFYALLWWHLAAARGDTSHAALYAGATILTTGGLLLAWHAVQARFGNLDMDRIGGLSRTMPRFALLLSLLVMAAVGLPPFGLFFGFIDMALHSGLTAITADLLIVLLAWFGASWYLFKLLQRLLFGPPRTDLVYDDLNGSEIASLVIVLVALIGLGLWNVEPAAHAAALARGMRTAMEVVSP